MRLLTALILTACSAPLGTKTDSDLGPRPAADTDTDSDTDTDTDTDTDSDTDTDTDTEPEPYQLFVDPPSIDFGTVSTDDVRTELVHIENIGTESVHLNGMGSSNSAIFDVTADFALPVTMTPGMERTLQVSFSPDDSSIYSGEITFITEEALAEDVDLGLQGEGDGPPCEICSPVISVVTSDGSSRSLDMYAYCTTTGTVTVQNAGDRALEVYAAAVVNDAIPCGHFSVSWPGPRTLSPGASLSMTVTYTVTGSGCVDAVDIVADWNTLHITSNDPSEPDYVVELNGAGICL